MGSKRPDGTCSRLVAATRTGQNASSIPTRVFGHVLYIFSLRYTVVLFCRSLPFLPFIGTNYSFLVVVILTSTRIITSVVTGQAPVTLEWRNNPGENTRTKPKVGLGSIWDRSTSESEV